MKRAAWILALLACPASATPVNLVSNPGFEAGIDFWQARHFALGANAPWAHSGARMARLGYCDSPACLDVLDQGAFIGQTLATTAGARYDLSFWVRSVAGESGFSVFWDGALLFRSAAPNGEMLHYSFAGLSASSASTALQVHAYNTLDRHVSFDDFEVSQSRPIREPGVWSLLLAGLVSLHVWQRARCRPGSRPCGPAAGK